MLLHADLICLPSGKKKATQPGWIGHACAHAQMVVVAGIHHKGPLSADPGHKPAYSSPPMHACMEYKLNKTASHNSMLAKLLNQFNLQQHQIINLRCLVFNTPPPPPCVIYIVDFVVLARSLSVADGLFN